MKNTSAIIDFTAEKEKPQPLFERYGVFVIICHFQGLLCLKRKDHLLFNTLHLLFFVKTFAYLTKSHEMSRNINAKE